MKNQPKNLIIHHSAVSRYRNSCQYTAINNYHKNLGWGGIGYHYLIEPNGRIMAGREENIVGAHCCQKYMNFLSIGICLTGNLDTEKPTSAQIFALRDLLRKLTKKYKISKNNIWFHRDFAPKTCPGKNMDRGFVRSLVTNK